MKVTTFSGAINWDSDLSDTGDVSRAILRDNGEFAIDCTFEGVRYDVRLNRLRTDYYQGTFNATDGSKSWSGTVACRVWHSGDDVLARGDWLEGGSKYIWTTKLQIEELN
jgi:hypothetical protein